MATATATLTSAPLFTQLSEKTREMVARSMRERSFPAGVEIVTEGEGGIGFFVIVEGAAEAIHPREARPRARLGPGAAFGEIALLDGGPRSATVRAVTDVRCAILTRWDFLAILRGEASVAVELLEALAGRIRALEGRIAELEEAAAR